METLKNFLKKSRKAIFSSVLAIFLAFIVTTAAASGDDVLRVNVDRSECCGCGLCEVIAPHNFAIIDEKAVPLLGGILYMDELIEAYEICPNMAIYFTEF